MTTRQRAFEIAAFLLLVFSTNGIFAQVIGAEAQSGQESASQRQIEIPKTKASKQLNLARTTAPTMLQIHADQQHQTPKMSLWGKHLTKYSRPTQPQRPIPILLIVLGSLMVLLWAALLLIAIISSSAFALPLAILLIVFSPLLIFGIIFIIGGFIAGFAVGKSRPAPSAD